MTDVTFSPGDVARFCTIVNGEKDRVLAALRGKGFPVDVRLDIDDPGSPALVFVMEGAEEVRVEFALYSDPEH